MSAYFVFTGSDDEHCPHTEQLTRDELLDDLAEEASDMQRGETGFKYLSQFPEEGIQIGEKLIIKGEVITPRTVEVVKRFEID